MEHRGLTREGVPEPAQQSQGRPHRGGSLSEVTRHVGLCQADEQGKGVPGRRNNISKDLEAWASLMRGETASQEDSDRT